MVLIRAKTVEQALDGAAANELQPNHHELVPLDPAAGCQLPGTSA